MRFIQFVIAALPGASAAIARAACNADNCARAITGTRARPALEVRQTDCASFQTATEYPEAETTTVYDATADGTVYPTGLYDTIVMATDVPTYATGPCGTSSSVIESRYASACSCFGFPATTITAPVETVTVSTTESAVGSTPTCGAVRDTCADDRGLCQYSIEDGEIESGPLVCATYECPNENECESATDCAAGQMCVSAGAICGTFSCADLVS